MATPSETKPTKKRPSISRKKGQPKKPTRDIILAAATQVFSDYPYYTASIRMIGKAAGIEHPLVSYYFPNKAALFEEVLKTETEKYYEAHTTWFDGLAALKPEKGLSLYLDRFLEFARNHPKPLRIITLNLVQAEDSEIIPGYQQIQNFFEKTAATFTQKIPLTGSKEDIEKLTSSFNTLAINYLGAGTYYAGILGMDPASRQYIKWVKDSLTYITLPRLKKLLGEPS